MADQNIDDKILKDIQEKLVKLEMENEEMRAKQAGLEELANKASTEDSKLREKKNFEPKFRTVKLKKYPMFGDETNLGYVIGWTSKGAYQTVDRTGVSPQIVDMIDIIYLGNERNKQGKLQAESVKLLDLLNKGLPVICKILKEEKVVRTVPTGEEIHCTSWDPQHGLVDNGEVIDGYVAYTDITLTLQVPGISDPVVVDQMYVN